MSIAPTATEHNSPQDVHELSTHAVVTSDGYVVLNGVQIAWIGDDEAIYLHVPGWIAATKDMSFASQGALFTLIAKTKTTLQEVAS